MKKILIGSIMLLMIAATAETSNAQVSVSVNIGCNRIGDVGFDYVEYYYIPEYEVYYYVPNRQFVYFDGVNGFCKHTATAIWYCESLFNL